MLLTSGDAGSILMGVLVAVQVAQSRPIEFSATTPAFPQMTPFHPLPPRDVRGNFVVTVVNSHTAPVVTRFGQAVGALAPIQNKSCNATVLTRGETASFAVPTGWSGRLAMWEDGYSNILDRASLFEGTFGYDPGNGAVMAMDISYVDGFTVPITCGCNGTTVLGCNLNLLDNCPKQYLLNNKTCANPLRDSPSSGTGNIFGDCQNLAYTYSYDDAATFMGIPGCPRNVQCCVGVACKANPKQQVCPGPDGHARRCS
ncbi:hypothetical protein GGS23DRAFT_594689 [Durotheca rogersii]|uniref:uncharacterized protein n=1 Tax=Durotheca rogersii TaxID=419775 RepID=UPI00221E9C5B|nr:uncharacterized protein GGS23DRAFT_594689 [Durotheca rogersii]KAI5865140.1 hypothetical protein GGS23DRAFT_594689 [Durotheca rogersii]